MIGMRNASVLPVPVCAVARTSLPSRATRDRRGLDRSRRRKFGKRQPLLGVIGNL